MKRSLYSPPDAFSISPFLSLLPIKGKVGKLEAFTSSLYARFEKVEGLSRELGPDDPNELSRRLNAEREMLREILNWLMVDPEKAKE